MCEYIRENKCTLNNEICPYAYFCDKKQIWKMIKSMPKSCKIKEEAETPNGYYRVREERKGFLYVDIDGYTYKIKNPFAEIPRYVKASKTKSGEWRIKK